MELIAKIEELILHPIIGLIGAAALAYFIWGLVEFLHYVDNAEERKHAKSKMLYGVIGLAIMVCVFGILNVVCATIGCK